MEFDLTLVEPSPAEVVSITNGHSRGRSNGEANRLAAADRAVHDWYRFVLSFPPHLVRDYVARFELSDKSTVLDPFCGTGTTLVECKKQGIASVGIESHPMAHFASQVKTDWTPDPAGLAEHSKQIADIANEILGGEGRAEDPLLAFDDKKRGYGYRRLKEDARQILLTGSISPLPLHKTLVLLEIIDRSHHDPRFARHQRLALAKSLVTDVGNLQFGPEVGVGNAKSDAPVVSSWLRNVTIMAGDIAIAGQLAEAESRAHLADARHPSNTLADRSIDAVITSPPYPNEKDYTRTTRLESVILGFLRDKYELQAFKKGMIRSNTRNVFVDDDDDAWIARFPQIIQIAESIEQRRLDMGKTSGFERLYARVTKLYFGGMARHLADLRRTLRPGARLAYVVGDQASYLRIMIRTGQLVADIARSLGYEVESIDLFRTRLATATREQLREEVVVLRWPETCSKQGVHTSMTEAAPDRPMNRYSQIIERIFLEHFVDGATEVEFDRGEIETAAAELGIKLPKNIGDVVYTFRYRNTLPAAILERAPSGSDWIIRPVGRGRYRFVASSFSTIVPRESWAETKVPDSTPGIISMYALDDEQALLAKLRYNRLIDIFTGVTCYSLQNHLRTAVPGVGQVETDELYVGIDNRGAQYVIPVQAKGGKDKLSIVQIEQDAKMAAHKFPALICLPIAAQFIGRDKIAMFTFEETAAGLVPRDEKHYKLVPPEELTSEEIAAYRER